MKWFVVIMLAYLGATESNQAKTHLKRKWRVRIHPIQPLTVFKYKMLLLFNVFMKEMGSLMKVKGVHHHGVLREHPWNGGGFWI